MAKGEVFACNKCSANFSRKANRDRHQLLVHNRQQKAVGLGRRCSGCGHIFTKKCSLMRHLNGSLNCPRAKSNFLTEATSGRLSSHKTKEEIRCSMPSKQFQNFSFREPFDSSRPALFGDQLLSKGCTFVWYCSTRDTIPICAGVIRLNQQKPEYWVREHIDNLGDLTGLRGTLAEAIATVRDAVGSPSQEWKFGTATRQGQRMDLVKKLYQDPPNHKKSCKETLDAKRANDRRRPHPNNLLTRPNDKGNDNPVAASSDRGWVVNKRFKYDHSFKLPPSTASCASGHQTLELRFLNSFPSWNCDSTSKEDGRVSESFKGETNFSIQIEPTVKIEEKQPKMVVRLSLFEWMVIAERQGYRCGCACGEFLSSTSVVIRTGWNRVKIDQFSSYLLITKDCASKHVEIVAEISSVRDKRRIEKARLQNYRCPGYDVPCNLPLLPTVFDIDHAIPSRWGGRDDEENKHVLCENCHGKKSSHETNLSTTGSLIPIPEPFRK